MTRIPEFRARNADFWARAAAGWIRQAERHDQLGHPLGAAAVEALRLTPGERVLDVGSGCGGTTAELAALVAPGGLALGVDLSPAMVNAASLRFPGLSFVAADIETSDPLPGSPFDAVFSRMTLMLLPDPVAGLTRIRKLLRPGGRLAATVFREGAGNPWLSAAVLGAAPHVGALPPLPIGSEPGPFAFADPSYVKDLLTRAGFTDPVLASHELHLSASEEPPDVAEWLIEIGPAGAAYRCAPTAQQEAARTGVARLLQRYRQPDLSYLLPTSLWLITATVPN
jgi:SAM-dependent methyltransferase